MQEPKLVFVVPGRGGAVGMKVRAFGNTFETPCTQPSAARHPITNMAQCNARFFCCSHLCAGEATGMLRRGRLAQMKELCRTVQLPILSCLSSSVWNSMYGLVAFRE
jgi:hypothetical protein